MTSSGQVVPFVKASACGNDFLIVDGSYVPTDIAGFSKRICDRHQGVGADGVEWLFPAKDADIAARLFNADGSEAEISGNGTRCVAAYLCSELRSENIDSDASDPPKNKFSIRTGAGIKVCNLIGRNQNEYDFEVAMGAPQVEKELSIRLASREVTGIPVSMGNPHYVMFVQEYAAGWQADAAEIGARPDFKHGINVELVIVKDKSNVEARFFERGVGETQSSGTGSCASGVAAIWSKRAASPVRVHAPGGIQTVRWDDQVFLRGAAQLICRGEFWV
jgi:diaminopimelate epimerase